MMQLTHATGKLIFKKSRLDLWMDSVLLTVLKNWPEHGPNMFLRMGKSLQGTNLLDSVVKPVGGYDSCSSCQDTFLKAITKQV